MLNIISRLQDERRRLESGPFQNEKPSGIGIVRLVARCPVGAHEVLTNAKLVLKSVDEAALSGWPAKHKQLPKLPDWFTSRCATPMSPEQAKQWLAWWRKLPPDEQKGAEAEKDWSLDDWLYWLEPSNRQWFWWDASVLSDCDHVVLAIEVDSWPFPWGSLRWLFRAAGASSVEAEE